MGTDVVRFRIPDPHRIVEGGNAADTLVNDFDVAGQRKHRPVTCGGELPARAGRRVLAGKPLTTSEA